MRWKILYVILAMTSVSGCYTVATEGCTVFGKLISTSSNDVLTRRTEDQLIAHNLKVEKYCRPQWGQGWR